MNITPDVKSIPKVIKIHELIRNRGREKIATVLQRTFLNEHSCMEKVYIWFKSRYFCQCAINEICIVFIDKSLCELKTAYSTNAYTYSSIVLDDVNISRSLTCGETGKKLIFDFKRHMFKPVAVAIWSHKRLFIKRWCQTISWFYTIWTVWITKVWDRWTDRWTSQKGDRQLYFPPEGNNLWIILIQGQ